MSEKVLHEWRNKDPFRPCRLIERNGEVLIQRLYEKRWMDDHCGLDVDVQEIMRLAAENERLRKCVEAADALRFNDVGLPSSAKDAYDAARKALEEK